MPWARVDDDFYDHPKVTELLAEPDGWGALGFWVACLAWAHKHTRKPGRRAGFMSRLDVIRMDRNVGEQYAGLLSKVHLWEPVDDGWLIHDFSLYLPKQATSAARAEAGRKGGLKSGQVRAAQSVERSTELQLGSKELQNRSKREASSEANPEANAGLGSGSVSDEVQVVEGSVVGADKQRQPRTRGTRLPDDFVVTAEMVAWCRKECPGVDGRKETAAFADYWRSQPGQRGVKLDWVATWRNWMRKASENPGRRPPPQGSLDDGFWER